MFCLLNTSNLTYEELKMIAEYLQKNTKYRPTIGVICGTGLGDLINALQDPNTFPYKTIPKFPVSTG